MNAYQCGAWFFPYEEDLGLPDEGIAPGTCWEEVADAFVCPNCGTPKAGFIVWHKE
jgi:rubredoxin